MLQDVEAMARSGETPQPDKLKTIKDIVESELVPDLKMCRDKYAAQVGVHLESIKSCNSNATDTLTTIEGSFEKSTDTSRTTHAECREEEKNKKAIKGDKCKELDDFLDSVNAPVEI